MKTTLFALAFAVATPCAAAHATSLLEQLDEQAWQTREAAITQALRSSDRPRDWVLAAMPAIGPSATQAGSAGDSAALLQRALAQAPNDALVLWLVANRALGAGDDAIAARSATALTRLEPDNATSWVPALALASRHADDARIDNALAGMAAATRYDDHFAEAVRAWMDIYDRHGSASIAPAASSGESFTAAMAKASAFALPAYAPLSSACKSTADHRVTAQRRADCSTAGRLMLQRGSTLVARSIGSMLLTQGGEGALTAGDRATLRTLDWLRYQGAYVFPNDERDSAALRAYAADWRALDDEVAVITRALRRAGRPAEPPQDWSPPRLGSG